MNIIRYTLNAPNVKLSTINTASKLDLPDSDLLKEIPESHDYTAISALLNHCGFTCVAIRMSR